MYALPVLSTPPDPRLWHGFTEDFDHLVSADRWTKIATDTGTILVGDAAGGIVTLFPSDGTEGDNDEVYLHTTAELFLIAADKPMVYEALCQFAQANTDDANVAHGFLSGPAANAIIDDGAGVDTNFSGAMFYCVDGALTWNVIYSDGATQTKAVLSAANSLDGLVHNAASAAYQQLQIEIIPLTSTLLDVLFYIDDVLVYKMKDQTYANATECGVTLGAKNGDTNAETVLFDLVMAYQKR